MPIIQDIDTFRTVVPVNKSMAYSTLSPFISQAGYKYLRPIMGVTEYDNFVTAVEGASTNAAQDAILPFAEKASAFYALLVGMPILNVNIGDLGISQQASGDGTAQSISQWRTTDLTLYLADQGDYWADELLAKMESMAAASFPDWEASPSFTTAKELMISNTTTLSEYVNIKDSRRTFLALRKFIILSQTKHIRPVIGKPLLDQIRTELLAGTLTAANTTLLDLIRPALAHLTIMEAIPQINVKVEADGITIKSMSTAPDRKNTLAADSTAIAEALRRAEETGKMYLVAIKSFLDDSDNIANYPLYASSDAYIEDQPRTWGINNAGRNSFMV